jgi:hypothetical protein
VAEQSALAREWRRLGRAATFVAVLTSPATFAWLYGTNDWPLPWALLGTFVLVIAFRGFVDVLAHKLIPRASLYGAGHELMEATSSPSAASGTGARSSAAVLAVLDRRAARSASSTRSAARRATSSTPSRSWRSTC